jgi:hypothetical protein
VSVVLGVGGRCVGLGGSPLKVLEDETGTPVRVLHRVDEDQRLAQDRIDVGVALGREQVVGLQQRRVGRRDLVAVHAVREPDDHRRVSDQAVELGLGHATRVGQPLQLRLHLIEAPDPLRAADDHQPERAAFPRTGVLEQARPVGRGLLQGLQVLPDLLRRRDFLRRLMTEHLPNGRDGGVVPSAGPERLLPFLGQHRLDARDREGREQGRTAETHAA